MFNIFKRKSEIDKLNDKYKKLITEAHALSTTNRLESDMKHAEALQVLQEMENLQKSS